MWKPHLVSNVQAGKATAHATLCDLYIPYMAKMNLTIYTYTRTPRIEKRTPPPPPLPGRPSSTSLPNPFSWCATIWKNSMVVAGSRRITIQPDSLCLRNIVRNSIACKLSTSHFSGLESQACFLSGKFNMKKRVWEKLIPKKKKKDRYVSYTMEGRVRILAFNICIRSARRVILPLTSLFTVTFLIQGSMLTNHVANHRLGHRILIFRIWGKDTRLR